MNLHTEFHLTLLMSSLVFLCQNIIRLPASFTSAVCQSNLQCESDGLKGPGCHDSSLRVHEHPCRTDCSTAQSAKELLSQPAPWTAAADQSCSTESPLLSQVILYTSCLYIHWILPGFDPTVCLFPVSLQLNCARY